MFIVYNGMFTQQNHFSRRNAFSRIGPPPVSECLVLTLGGVYLRNQLFCFPRFDVACFKHATNYLVKMFRRNTDACRDTSRVKAHMSALNSIANQRPERCKILCESDCTHHASKLSSAAYGSNFQTE